jgi:hypothetical protein
MNLQSIIYRVSILLLVLVGCQKEDRTNHSADLNSIKTEFIDEIQQEDVIESPFHLHYTFKTVFFSKEIISLFGELNVYNHLPHGWSRYEGKTLCKINNQFREVALDDLFSTEAQKEFLRSYCEHNLKNENEQFNYFSEGDPISSHLDIKSIHTFILDHRFLIIIFQPYCVGGCGDGPFTVKIPYEHLIDHWNMAHPMVSILTRVINQESYSSSWRSEEGYYRDESGTTSIF